ncbi:Fc receptor-like protein 5 [Bufo gargarizans]|uniref:Fc receptor-like protein 5 n=1 Tax=Bufo gargarizans TaxID=30331 RepID=UPI001CF4A6BF|nr:Fc receptor-like protein 5 [Bufo gargarizans]
MSPETSVLLLLMVLLNVGHSSRPVVTFTPNSKKIFRTESISMTCDVGPTEQNNQKYDWFRTGAHVHNGKTYAIESAKTSHSGSYQCFSQHASDPYRLDVSDGWVILQAPNYVYEGDDLTLRCHHYPAYTARQTQFYKDNKVIQSWIYNDLYRIPKVDTKMSGTYKCEKEVKRRLVYRKRRDEESIYVRELFSVPTISANLDSKEENMTLTCETSLYSSRPNTQLQFAFYNEGQILQEFGLSNTCEVNIGHLGHSGKYSCGAQTLDGKVWKKSAEQLIQIEGSQQGFMLRQGSISGVLCCKCIRAAGIGVQGLTRKRYLASRHSRGGGGLIVPYSLCALSSWGWLLCSERSSAPCCLRPLPSWRCRFCEGNIQAEDDFSFYTREHCLRSSIMSPETSVFLLWLVLIQEGASIRPVVTFTPNYKKIFTTESITMTCDVEATRGEDLKYIWYKDHVQVHSGKSYTIQNAGTSHSGNYGCQTSTGEISDPARLDVRDDWLILQTPLYVYEGDEMTLRCHHYPGYGGKQTRFYKEDKVITDGSDDEEFHISNVDRTSAGKYKCTKEVFYRSSSAYGAEASVSVEELFTTPTIKVTPHPVFKKNNMTLKCETSLHPPRQNTQIQFAFYREGRIVQGFGDKDIYDVSMVQLEHSGNYSCEVQTTDGRVRKKSVEELIQIEELFSHPNIKVTSEFFEGDALTLTCHTTLNPHTKPTEVQFAFYRDGQMVREFDSSNKYEVQTAHLEHSGNYTCEVKSLTHPTRKISNWSKILVKELFTTPTIKVTPHPVFKKNNMTLKCETSLHPPRQNTQIQFAFYREGRIVQGFGDKDIYDVSMVQLEHSGNYSCEVQTTDGRVRKRSAEEPIQIEELFSHPNIKVTNEFFEGDALTLTCHTTLHPHTKPTEVQFAFYRDGQMVGEFDSSNKYEVQTAHLEHSGNYTCEVKSLTHPTRKISNWSKILAKELFSPPVLRVSPELVNEGENMILSCDTKLSEHRQTTELQYAFYRDGEDIQGFNSSNIYDVSMVQLEHSGNYSCEVQTTDGRVRKKSAEEPIQIEELFSHPNIKVTKEFFEGDALTLTCHTTLHPHTKPTLVQFAFYRDGQMVREFDSSNKYEVQTAHLEHSGNYTCEVKSLTHPTRKISNWSKILVKDFIKPYVNLKGYS